MNEKRRRLLYNEWFRKQGNMNHTITNINYNELVNMINYALNGIPWDSKTKIKAEATRSNDVVVVNREVAEIMFHALCQYSKVKISIASNMRT